MKLRKLRNWNFGASNKDWRRKIKHSKYNQNQMDDTHLQYLTKPTNFTRRVKQANKKDWKNQPFPIETTRDFYKKIEKVNKERVNIEFTRYGHLQERAKGKPWFTGDGNLIYSRRSGLKPKKKRAKSVHEQHYVHKYTKADVNARAAQETQLVGMDKYKWDTLEGKVDLDKVKEVRRMVRRRYANRKRIQKIFGHWDVGKKGFIAIKDVVKMASNLGLKVNFDEARVLIASADQNENGQLNLDEFMDMIYNTGELFNVDLAKIPKLNENQQDQKLIIEKELLDGDGIIRNLAKEALKAREARHQNQLRLIIQKRIKKLNNEFLKEDYVKKGTVNKEKFYNILGNLQINEQIMTDADIRKMFNKHKVDEHTMDYKQFLFDIRSFKFQPEKIYLIDENGEKQRKKELIKNHNDKIQMAIEKFNPPQDSKLTILDISQQPVNNCNSLFMKSRKVGRIIQRYFPKKKDFEKYMADSLLLNFNDLNDSTISQKDFHNVLCNIFKQFDDNINKRDIEGFLSVFQYNKHKETDTKLISGIIYDEDEKKFFNRIQRKIHGPPPVSKLAQKEMARAQTANGRNRPDSDTLNPLKNQELKTTLEKFDEGVFFGTETALQTFRRFDKDGDGYVSIKDIKTKLKQLNILTEKETNILLNYAGMDKKGFLDYNEWTKKFRPNMVWEDDTGSARTMFYHQTGTVLRAQRNLNNLKSARRVFDDFHDRYKPDGFIKLKSTSRFGSRPQYKNTFLNHQPKQGGCQYISEQKRFDKSHLRKTQFQINGKQKRAQTAKARQNRMRLHNNWFEDKNEKQFKDRRQKQLNKWSIKQQRQFMYEHRCQLQNDFK